MQKFRNPIPAVKLREATTLSAKCSNETRWSSAFEMIDRYQSIRKYIAEIDIDGIENMLVTRKEDRQIDVLHTQFSLLHSVTKLLQSESTSFADARTLFDAVVENFAELKNKLRKDADIVLTQIVKVES